MAFLLRFQHQRVEVTDAYGVDHRGSPLTDMLANGVVDRVERLDGCCSDEQHFIAHDGCNTEMTARGPDEVVTGRGGQLAPTHEFVDHTSELVLHVRAPSFAALVAEAGRALGELLRRGTEVTESAVERSFEIAASDRGSLLVDFLNDLIFRAETERWVPTEIETQLTGDRAMRIVARGCLVDPAPTLVKAATFHALDVRNVGPVIEAEVTLDV